MNNTTIATVIAVLIVVGGGYYFLSNGSIGTPAPLPTTTAPEATTTTVPSPTAAVSIQNFAFSSSALSVKTGTKVTWTNNDSVPHTVTSDSSGLFNSQPIAPGQSFSYTFTGPGTVSYHCAIHPMMKGSVSVSN